MTRSWNAWSASQSNSCRALTHREASKFSDVLIGNDGCERDNLYGVVVTAQIELRIACLRIPYSCGLGKCQSHI